MNLDHKTIFTKEDEQIALIVRPLSEKITKRVGLEDNDETRSLFSRALERALYHYRRFHSVDSVPDYGFPEYYTFFVSSEIDRLNE